MDSEWLQPGIILKTHRKRFLMKQRELGSLIGVRQHHISEMECGKRCITIFTAKRIGRVFEIDYRVFL